MARDPGLQPERTSLAWSRTAMAMFVNALLLLRSAALDDHLLLLIISAVLAGAALLMFMHARRRGAELRLSPQHTAHPRLVWLTSAACLLAVCAGLAEVTLSGAR